MTTDQLLDGREQLRRRFREWQYGQQWLDALDEALAVERVATVERIRAALELIPDRFMQVPEPVLYDREESAAGPVIHLIPRDNLLAILDEVAS